MADNTTINPGTGGDVIAADEINSVKHQRVKIQYGEDGSATDASPTNPLPVSVASNGTQNLNLYRFLDTDGDGGGTKNATGNYSGAAQTFSLAPPLGTVYRVARLIISLEDTQTMAAEEYGNLGSALTNGITIRIHNGTSTVLDITDGVPIKTNAHWGAKCYDVDVKTWGNGQELLCARWTFTQAGQYLRIDGTQSEELQVVLNDDFTGLITQYFFAQGYTESSAT